MAVVKNPFLSTDARGSIFGLTASFVRGGNVVKRKPNPSRKGRPALNTVRAILGFLSRQWGELSSGARTSWDVWAQQHPGIDKFGDQFIMSGFNAFIKLNHTAMRLFVGDGFYDLPPEDPPASAVDILTVATGAGVEGDIDLSWTELGTGVATDKFEVEQAGPFQSPGRRAVDSMFTSLTTVAGNVLLETIGSLNINMWYWYRVRYVDAFGQTTVGNLGQATPKVGV